MPKLTHISDYLIRNAHRYPNKLAVVTENRSLTWQQLLDAVEPAAQRIRQLEPNDEQVLIGLLISNTWEYVVCYLAILEAGHIAVPLDVIYKQLEIDAITSQMKPKLILTDQANRSRVGAKTKALTLADLQPDQAQIAPLRLDPAQQIATIFFTSGTTGRPKAAPYSHTNHLWNIKVCSQVWDWTERDSMLLSLRLSHWYGSVMGLSGILYHANTMYLQDRFDVTTTLELLAGGHISMFTHAPLVYAKLVEAGRQADYDLSPVRLFISGSGPLPPKVWHEFKGIFGHEILEVYGSSETGRIASNHLNDRKPGSPGPPLPEVEVKFIDSEVAVRSPGLFPGYFHNETLTNERLTDDGFWRTGDLGLIDEHDRLVLKGRRQEIIRRQGYTISPRDVEWAVHTNPAVKEIIVIGQGRPNQPDDELVYFLVSTASAADILAFCRQNLPSVWRPTKLIFLDELPRTSRGKTDMAKLRAMIN